MRELCTGKRITFSHLPDRAGLGTTHFWAVVRGRSSPTLRWLVAIAGALDVDVVDLLQPQPTKGRS
jgi:hypothetical protein